MKRHGGSHTPVRCEWMLKPQNHPIRSLVYNVKVCARMGHGPIPGREHHAPFPSYFSGLAEPAMSTLLTLLLLLLIPPSGGVGQGVGPDADAPLHVHVTAFMAGEGVCMSLPDPPVSGCGPEPGTLGGPASGESGGIRPAAGAGLVP